MSRPFAVLTLFTALATGPLSVGGCGSDRAAPRVEPGTGGAGSGGSTGGSGATGGATTGGTGGGSGGQEGSPIRVVFIGNSLTFVNDLPRVLTSLGASADPPVTFDASQNQLVGGETLGGHFILHDEWIDIVWDVDPDFIVLQDQSAGGDVPGSAPELWHAVARSTGSRAILFMTWGTFWTDEASFVADGLRLEAEANAAAANLGITVAPAGRAWLDYYEPVDVIAADDGSELHADYAHPTKRGTYLAALVFFATLTGRSPLGLGDGGLGIVGDEAEALQQLAEAAVAGNALSDPDAQPTPLPDDHGNTWDDATPLELGTTLAAEIGPSDPDFFSFHLDAAATVAVDVQHQDADKFMELLVFDASRSLVARTADLVASDHVTIAGLSLSAGDYFVYVTGASFDQTLSTTNYALLVSEN